MAIAQAKWQKRCAQRSFEQRAQAKARLFETPTTSPQRKLPRSNVSHGGGGFVATAPIYYTNQIINSYTTIPLYQMSAFTPSPYDYQMRYYTTMPMTQQTQGIWNNWAGTTQTITSTFTGQLIWNTWNGNINQVQLTREQQAAAVEAARIRRATDEAHYAVARQEREAAREKALQLFLHVLSPEERASYEREKCIYVRGSRGRRYRIRCGHQSGQSHNVELLGQRDAVLSTLCAHPGEMVPDPDAWMVQKLTLELDEDHFVNTANFSNRDALRLVPAI